ncbi:amidase [Oceaniglobus roseus]|uniref:amidase n=1 Tax=Oceaniglobus roseus TaxID=1737570 RepID=UPI000C7E9C2F|nr:amidase family protein [Kandeliimicrobium roseum]
MPPFSGPDLCALDATEAVALLAARKVSPAELVEAAAARHAAVDGAVNAMPILCADRARAAAATPQGAPLHGLPLAIKDLTPVRGVRTTFGTPGFADFVPPASDPLVERLEGRGGIVIGKTNTPEMGAGGNTFNAVFGMTRNPWNTARNAGGSSGGAAAALASGQVWLAHGSDLAGSLRTPAAYCGVVGLRCSPGVAGGASATNLFNTMSVQGPMARNVRDCALFLDAMAGEDLAWPLSRTAPATAYAKAVLKEPGPVRIAFSPTMGGFAPCDTIMEGALAGALARLSPAFGTDETFPDLSGLEQAYITFRAMVWAAGPGRLPQEIQSRFKTTLKENIALGQTLDIQQVYDAQIARTAVYNRVAAAFAQYDVLAAPSVGLMPGPVEDEYPSRVGDTPVKDYVDWLKFSFLATTLGLPALVLPVALVDGLPVGLQLIARPHAEAQLLRIAHRIEQELDLKLGPIDPVAG